METNNLKTLPDLVLVNNIKNQNQFLDQSIRILSERHSGLFFDIVSRTTGNSTHWQQNVKSDILQEKEYVVWDAAKTFDDSRDVKFSTHFGNTVRWNCLKRKTQASKTSIEISIESEPLSILSAINDTLLVDMDSEKYISSVLMEEINKIKNKRDKKILMLRYFSSEKKNLPWKKISEEVKLSVQGCINVNNKYLEQIRKRLVKNKEITL